MVDHIVLTEPAAMVNPKDVCRPLATLCERIATVQQLDMESLKAANTYALLGIADDGSVMALTWRDDAWLLTRAPVPSVIARSEQLGLTRLDNQAILQPVWARVNPKNLMVYREARWQSIGSQPITPVINNKPNSAMPTDLSVIDAPNMMDVLVPADDQIPGDIGPEL